MVVCGTVADYFLMKFTNGCVIDPFAALMILDNASNFHEGDSGSNASLGSCCIDLYFSVKVSDSTLEVFSITSGGGASFEYSEPMVKECRMKMFILHELFFFS